MTQPFIGEIRLFAGNFPPAEWAFCQGQMLPIAEYEALFQLIGTTYGGDGQEYFALPDLQGRVPLHAGSQGGRSFVLGEASGVEAVTLSTAQLPAHSHARRASSQRGSGAYSNLTGHPAATVGAGSAVYGLSDGSTQAMAGNAVTAAGNSQPHDNMAPYLGLNFIIALRGDIPSVT
jgi:microcystin-dependent protein